ncbi:hypothetical protein CC1G_13020 [Coprinopsis cinerea okayama7|uniref:F-box domain-containing protein n=1 Tax=Coprinopsis cinerea (strain Okayama-7 / 130 / ATCC MYA-4618 / FGSC 9003) TaxID=240176 RepID=A8N418_COPC7|nr:hypothetical protein CC1G_13020 [Coprinopsis cinerea okayama7\|eukprot:XP_001829613.1 hypothetical protein CC1G_13020 [Coprinopsis cinerea okayama7\
MYSQVLLTAFEIVGNLVQRSLASYRESRNPKHSRLLGLPYELLIDIATNLEWKDILQIRQTCRTLNRVSRERPVWLALLYRYYETKFPRPFFLPKPLHFCSASDLERRITWWWKGVEGLMEPVEIRKFQVVGLENEESSTITEGPLPGGRYFLYTLEDGRVGYIDSEQPHPEFTELIPCPSIPHLCQGSYVATRLAIDVLSQQEYAPDLQSVAPLSDQLFLSSFNLALLRRASETPILCEVWRITARIEEGEVVGYFADLLNSFLEDSTVRLTGPCALYGKNLAFNVTYPAKVVTIVD